MIFIALIDLLILYYFSSSNLFAVFRRGLPVHISVLPACIDVLCCIVWVEVGAGDVCRDRDTGEGEGEQQQTQHIRRH